jgi:hypothetical protein
MNIYPTEEVTDQLLYELGLTRDDITQEAAEVESTPKETFQAFDSYGNIYNDAYVNDENVVVSSSGTPLEGAYVDTDGKVIDGYGNHVSQVEVVSSEEEKVDNPDMAVPPDQDTGNAEDSTLWDPSTLLDDEE